MSGLYNAINGYNPACVLVLPMLGRGPDDYPRFRDCFIDKEEKTIIVLTRVGGNNRGCEFGEEELYKDPNYVRTYDDEFDNTYGYYVFNVPEKWRADFEMILAGKLNETSDEYEELITGAYPDIKDTIHDFLRGES